MDTIQIAIAIIGFLVFLAVLLALNAIFRRSLNLKDRLNREEVKENNNKRGFKDLIKHLERVLIPMGEWLPRSPAEMSRQESNLVRAGIRRKDGVILLNGAHIGIALLTLAVFATTGHLYRKPAMFVMLAVISGAALPDIWLKRKIQQRQDNIRYGLPDAMDLAVISVEAGLGLDQALLRVGQEIKLAYPDLADELYLRNVEVNMGRSRAEAFRNLAARTGVEDLQALVAILIQTDRFGTNVGQALRTFSDSLRTKRRQRAEEQAAKLSIKMIVPMVLFIFPGVFIVMLGPAFISIVTKLIPLMTGQ